ncbi:MAG: plasmid pRiA4b ORF-3 family protein [Phycisphaeraceae bacterium]|nr:plasmid pRiA4b ORF-3 family protein [Phycisphaeraceae bacterium]
MNQKLTQNNAMILRIELSYIKPKIWREVQVPLGLTLDDLHMVIQIAMGWQNGHLHQYDCHGECVGMLDEESPEGMVDESDVFVGDVFETKGAKITYMYDFGDGWEHTIKCQQLKDAEDPSPVILKGKNACPPEDCGGEPGYEHLVEVMADTKHPEHEEMLEWLGCEFDPTVFDLEEANEILRETTELLEDLQGQSDDEDLDLFGEASAYDPLQTPDSQAWLALDEAERIMAVEAYHEEMGETLPGSKMHAIVHTIVENQLAENLLETHRTLKRLMDDGLDRHDGIHAVGSVLSQHMFNAMKKTGGKNANADYHKLLKELTVEKWMNM